MTAATTTTTTTLAARTAGLMTKASALEVVEKAMAQAIAAKRVHPAMATDFGAQLGYELPLKTRDFVRVIGHLMQASEKPLKGVISKRKSEILAVLAELVGALTGTEPVALPEWAKPKERASKKDASEAEAEAEASSVGALEKANALALAEANAAKAEANAAKAEAEAAQDMKLAQAIDLVVSRAGELTEAQRRILLSALASTEPAPF